MRRLAILPAVALVATIATSSPANAEQVTYRTVYGGDAATVTAGYTAHAPNRQQYRHINISDQTCDGVRAWVQYGIDGGDGERLYQFYDANGCTYPGYGTTYDRAVTVTRFRVGRGAVPHVAWSAWQSTPTTAGQ